MSLLLSVGAGLLETGGGAVKQVPKAEGGVIKGAGPQDGARWVELKGAGLRAEWVGFGRSTKGRGLGEDLTVSHGVGSGTGGTEGYSVPACHRGAPGAGRHQIYKGAELAAHP